MQKFVVLDKKVGETPLECAEKWRAAQSPAYADVPLAYAGRLDPMASGKLLVLIGDECKLQEKYHGLDKEYEFEVLFDVRSDTGDVLGLIETCSDQKSDIVEKQTKEVCKKLIGNIDLPYPHFSSKTVQGKPLHTWTLEGRLNEIDIPTKSSRIYKLSFIDSFDVTRDTLYKNVSEKIETIPPIIDPKKALGNDFRRPLVRESWKNFHNSRTIPDMYTIGKFRCTASSGTYMRTLADVIARELGTCGLAYSIHRTKIGRYKTLPIGFGYWSKKF